MSGTHLAVDSSMVEAWDCQFSESASKRRAARREQKKHEAPVAEQLQLEHPETEPKNGERTAEETQVQQARSSVPGGKRNVGARKWKPMNKVSDRSRKPLKRCCPTRTMNC
ncbi:hypothetical protein ACFSQ7_49455 [Paenibacillus rhizoplanae]